MWFDYGFNGIIIILLWLLPKNELYSYKIFWIFLSHWNRRIFFLIPFFFFYFIHSYKPFNNPLSTIIKPTTIRSFIFHWYQNTNTLPFFFLVLLISTHWIIFVFCKKEKTVPTTKTNNEVGLYFSFPCHCQYNWSCSN